MQRDHETMATAIAQQQKRQADAEAKAWEHLDLAQLVRDHIDSHMKGGAFVCPLLMKWVPPPTNTIREIAFVRANHI